MKGLTDMAKLDRLKEELSYIKYYISVAMIVILAVVGWIFTNIEKAEWYLIAPAFASVVFAVFYIYSRNKRVYQLLKEIEDA